MCELRIPFYAQTEVKIFLSSFSPFIRERKEYVLNQEISRFIIFLVKSKQIWAYFTDYDRLMEFRSSSLNVKVYNVKY